MSSSHNEHEPSVLHLEGGGEFSRQVGEQLKRAGLSVRSLDNVYLAMGWMAARRSRRAVAVLVDSTCLTDGGHEFPRLAVSLTANGAVYVYGKAEAMEQDRTAASGGVRIVTSLEQMSRAIGEIEQRVRLAEQLRTQSAARPDVTRRDAKRSPAGPDEPAADTRAPGRAVSPGEPDGPRHDHTAGDSVLTDSSASDVQKDALTDAASRAWDHPVLELVDTEDEAIARILPELGPDAELNGLDGNEAEVPTPWSPSTRRPTRKPPIPPDRVNTAEAGPPGDRSTEPVLTPEELQALLGGGPGAG